MAVNALDEEEKKNVGEPAPAPPEVEEKKEGDEDFHFSREVRARGVYFGSFEHGTRCRVDQNTFHHADFFVSVNMPHRPLPFSEEAIPEEQKSDHKEQESKMSVESVGPVVDSYGCEFKYAEPEEGWIQREQLFGAFNPQVENVEEKRVEVNPPNGGDVLSLNDHLNVYDRGDQRIITNIGVRMEELHESGLLSRAADRVLGRFKDTLDAISRLHGGRRVDMVSLKFIEHVWDVTLRHSLKALSKNDGWIFDAVCDDTVGVALVGRKGKGSKQSVLRFTMDEDLYPLLESHINRSCAEHDVRVIPELDPNTITDFCPHVFVINRDMHSFSNWKTIDSVKERAPLSAYIRGRNR